ncbi:MAG TPA: hypothetical protein VGE52_19850 [Pirellulales bacterium]
MACNINQVRRGRGDQFRRETEQAVAEAMQLRIDPRREYKRMLDHLQAAPTASATPKPRS